MSDPLETPLKRGGREEAGIQASALYPSQKADFPAVLPAGIQRSLTKSDYALRNFFDFIGDFIVVPTFGFAWL